MRTIEGLAKLLGEVRLDPNRLSARLLPDDCKLDILRFCRGGIQPAPEWPDPRKPATATATAIVESGFTFGATSGKELIGVDPRLVEVSRLALKISKQDFMVFDGLRTPAEQRQHIRNGTSRTMQSKHLLGLAVDLVPWIGGEPKWDWDGCYEIALAVDAAATQLGYAHLITWGGAWDRKLSDFGGDADSYRQEVLAYQRRHPGPDFVDGPHFEILPRN